MRDHRHGSHESKEGKHRKLDASRNYESGDESSGNQSDADVEKASPDSTRIVNDNHENDSDAEIHDSLPDTLKAQAAETLSLNYSQSPQSRFFGLTGIKHETRRSMSADHTSSLRSRSPGIDQRRSMSPRLAGGNKIAPTPSHRKSLSQDQGTSLHAKSAAGYESPRKDSNGFKPPIVVNPTRLQTFAERQGYENMQ